MKSLEVLRDGPKCCNKGCTYNLDAEQLSEIRKSASSGTQVQRRAGVYHVSALSKLCQRALAWILNLSTSTVNTSRSERGMPAAHGLTGVESPTFDYESFDKVNDWVIVHTTLNPETGSTLCARRGVTISSATVSVILGTTQAVPFKHLEEAPVKHT